MREFNSDVFDVQQTLEILPGLGLLIITIASKMGFVLVHEEPYEALTTS